jgi:hypothetical protein
MKTGLCMCVSKIGKPGDVCGRCRRTISWGAAVTWGTFTRVIANTMERSKLKDDDAMMSIFAFCCSVVHRFNLYDEVMPSPEDCQREMANRLGGIDPEGANGR